MAEARKILNAYAHTDFPIDNLDEAFSFYILEGKCKKCKSGDNSLIVTNFIENTSDRKESIFRTQCICCATKSIYYAKQISLSI